MAYCNNYYTVHCDLVYIANQWHLVVCLWKTTRCVIISQNLPTRIQYYDKVSYLLYLRTLISMNKYKEKQTLTGLRSSYTRAFTAKVSKCKKINSFANTPYYIMRDQCTTVVTISVDFLKFCFRVFFCVANALHNYYAYRQLLYVNKTVYGNCNCSNLINT